MNLGEFDQSGRFSRAGYRYQDLCALRYCISAAHDGRWDEIHCESADDVVLVRRQEEEARRFVQVKHEGSAASHWSVARLTTSPIDESIAVKLFTRGLETTNREFRLAVNEGVDDALRPMSYVWGSAEPASDLTSDGARALLLRLSNWDPGNGETAEAFLGSFLMELHSNTMLDLEARLYGELVSLLLSLNEGGLLDDDIRRVFRTLFWMVFNAASAADPAESRIDVALFREAAVGEARRSRLITSEVASDQGGALDRFLSEAGVGQDEIETCRELRRNYLRDWRNAAGTPRARILESWHSSVVDVIEDELAVRGRSPRDLLDAVMSRLPEISNQAADADTLRGIVLLAISRGAMA